MASAKTTRRGRDDRVDTLIDDLKSLATAKDRANLARFNIVAPRAFGVSMANVQKVAKKAGKDHALALALWATGWYEARLLTSFVDEPALVTAAQMDRWCRDFDNWGVCDTLCFNLFDRTPYAWTKVTQWAGKRDEFVRRAAFALLWSLTVHDKAATDRQFRNGLELVEAAATDERYFVKKAVNMALRAVGKRNAALNRAALTVAERLARSKSEPARWTGTNAASELRSASVTRRLARVSRAT